MALDGIGAVQSRIQEIEQLAASGTPPTTSSTDAPSADFASLLMDALGNSSDPTGSMLGSGSGGATGTGLGTGSVDLMSLLSQLTGSASSGVQPPTMGSRTSASAQQFLATAMAEKGKPYVYGATASTSDPNPPAFDCSELTKWAAARVGVTIPDGATAQYLYTRDHSTTMSVDQALHTPGALLFHFGHEPRNLGDIPADGHVAISVGDGVHTIEARGHAYGTNVFDASGMRAGFFNYAGMIPGM